MKLELVATCLFGLEKLLGEEIDALGYQRVDTMDGRVTFLGDERAVFVSNLKLRFAERVFIKLGAFRADSFEELFEGTKALPWENFIGREDSFPVKGHAIKSKLFSVPDCQSIVKKAVVQRLSNERQGTKSTLTRSEVRGGGAKPWRQKGTGRARQGSIRSPQWIKGGVVFAPKSRDFSKKMNAKAKAVALLSALSQKIRDNEVIFVDEIKVSAPKTKEMATFLKAFDLTKSVLLVMDNSDEAVLRASANIKPLTTVLAQQLNTYEVVRNAKLVISKQAVQQIEEVYGE
jgi:large subunit ribosomal protein L4